ncbi:hypothetical protein PR048_012228 [Dryococelus australis]|uniref:Uncharacterized protein n=1 Tax=Dryococelus australis TaxID=614101 RepID=A0ABQ9HNU3_9NEOP|nr:hypothetical protein PR048_012228 [Dryococelus australis]
MLLTQHVTRAAATGTSPAELRTGCRLRTCLDTVHPDLAEEMKQKQGANRVPVALRRPKWVPAIIVEVSVPISYKVITNDGVQMKRYVDQLLPWHVSPRKKV